MRKLQTIGLIVAALLAVSALTATMATGYPKYLPATGFPVKFTDKSGPGILVGASSVECKKDESTGEILTSTLGEFNVLFLGCSNALAGSCKTGNSSVAGSILVLGTFHLVLLDPGPVAGIAFLPRPATIECGGIATVVTKGCVPGPTTPTSKFTLEFKVSLKAKAAGSKLNEFLTYLNGELKPVECHLESNLNGGAFEISSEETQEVIGLLLQEAEIML